MAVPMASLGRAAKPQLPGQKYYAPPSGPGAPPAVTPSAPSYANPPASAAPTPAPPVVMDPYGVVPRPAPTPPAAAPVALTPQQRADEEAATLARQRAADVAAGRRPAEIDPRAQIAEEQRKSNDLQMQRAAVLRQQQEEERQRVLSHDAQQRAEQEQIAADRQQQTDEARAFTTQLSRTPVAGTVTRQEGSLDAAASRDDLSALIDLARSKGLLEPASSSSGALGSLQAAAALPPPVVHAPATSATSAAFSRAKDTVGKIGRSALDSLTRQMSGRGLSGSSIEGRGIADAVGYGVGALSDTARSEALADADRENAVADQTYQGDISQRNTDIAAQEEARRLGLAQQAQAQSRTNSQFSNLQGLAALMRRGRPVY